MQPDRPIFLFARALYAGLTFVGACASASAGNAAAPATVPLENPVSIGPLPDIVQGSPAATDTIVEYASMTCSHCAAFHEGAWPQVKAEYVDTGRAKFILREFPLDPVATAGFMLARCAGPEKRNLLIDQLFSEQKAWAFSDRPIERLRVEAEKIGMSEAEFDSCLKDQRLFEAVNQTRERAAAAFDVHATPTFLVNGHKLTGELAISDFEKILDGSAR